MAIVPISKLGNYGVIKSKKVVKRLDILFFLRCAETTIAIVGMTMAIGSLRHQAKFRLIISLVILTAGCFLLTAIYQQMGVAITRMIFIPMIIFIIGGLIFFNSADKFWVTCFNFLTQYMIYMGITMICTLIVKNYFDSNTIIYLLIRAIAFTLVIYAQIKFGREPFRFVVSMIDIGWARASLLVAIFISLNIMLSIYPVMYYERSSFEQIEILLAYCSFFMVLYFTYFSLCNTAKKNDQLQFELDLKEKTKYVEVFKLLSETDPLTGLLNRKAFQQKAETCLSDDETAVLLFMDIDNLKDVNDSYGHNVGDEALTILSYALITSFKRTDIIARSGGDEFIVLVRKVQNDDVSIEQKIELFNENLRKKIVANPVLSDFSVSIGIATMKNKDDFRKIYTNADHAMYQAKKKGEKCNVFYAEEMANGLLDGLI